MAQLRKRNNGEGFFVVATWESLTCWDPGKRVKEETFPSLMIQRQDMKLVFTLPQTNVEPEGALDR